MLPIFNFLYIYLFFFWWLYSTLAKFMSVVYQSDWCYDKHVTFLHFLKNVFDLMREEYFKTSCFELYFVCMNVFGCLICHVTRYTTWYFTMHHAIIVVFWLRQKNVENKIFLHVEFYSCSMIYLSQRFRERWVQIYPFLARK